MEDLTRALDTLKEDWASVSTLVEVRLDEVSSKSTDEQLKLLNDLNSALTRPSYVCNGRAHDLIQK